MNTEMILILVLGFWVVVFGIVHYKVARSLSEKIDDHYEYHNRETSRNHDEYWALRADLAALQDHIGVEFKYQERRVLVVKK